MTTQIIEAFEKAGIKMTKAERIWNYLKDKPGRTVKQIQADLHMKSINAPIHYMQVGGLLRVEQERFNNRKRNLFFARGTVFSNEGLYSKPRAKSADADIPRAPTELPVVQPTLKPVVQPALKPFDLDNLTIGEARNLFNQLKKMFGA